jgi:trehalose 6-phosphate synthase
MRLVVVSNRVPVPRSRQKPTAGGLAVALEGALADYGGIWFGWNGKVDDRVPEQAATIEHEGITYATTPLSHGEYHRYYAGYANCVLWPLCHFMLAGLDYRPEYRTAYYAVNARFAEQLAQLLKGDELIWVNDYHLIPMAEHLRALGVNRPIGFFLHTPFPSLDLLRALPDWRDLLGALAEYDLIGVQTENDRRALEQSLVYGLGAKFVEGGVELAGRRVRTIALPVGVDVDDLADTASNSSDSRRVRRLTESLRSRDLIIGAERLDYSKGLPQRFDAYEWLLTHHEDRRGRTVYMQIVSPSRESVRAYEHLREQIESKAGHINGIFADFDWVPTRYINKTFARASLLGFFRISKVGLITPLRDGMNLVAKEFVAAQDPVNPGVLVLSELAGAAAELDSALLVNPYDTDGMGAAIERALSMPQAERIERWQDMITALRRNDLSTWRQRYLDQLQLATDPTNISDSLEQRSS